MVCLPTSSASLFMTWRTASTSLASSTTTLNVSKTVRATICLKNKIANLLLPHCVMTPTHEEKGTVVRSHIRNSASFFLSLFPAYVRLKCMQALSLALLRASLSALFRRRRGRVRTFKEYVSGTSILLRTITRYYNYALLRKRRRKYFHARSRRQSFALSACFWRESRLRGRDG